jgi:mono/diheme cytochrome c family protein
LIHIKTINDTTHSNGFVQEFNMVKLAAKFVTVAAVMVGLISIGWAEDTDAGKTAYLSSCGPCHGADAKGSGLFSVELKLKEPPPPLTGLAKRNDGMFPANAVSEIIDGRKLLAVHGTREMPIWGFDVMVRGRIAAIVDYLERIPVM